MKKYKEDDPLYWSTRVTCAIGFLVAVLGECVSVCVHLNRSVCVSVEMQ